MHILQWLEGLASTGSGCLSQSLQVHSMRKGGSDGDKMCRRTFERKEKL